ncbi:hypothetical protein PG987_008071 [Apiospora arundinis]
MPKADEIPFLAPEEQDIEKAQSQYKEKRSVYTLFYDALQYWHWVIIIVLVFCLVLVSEFECNTCADTHSFVRATEIPGILPVLRRRQETVKPFFRPDHIFPNGSYFPRYSDYVGPATHQLDSLWEELDPPNLMSLDAAELGDFASQAMENPLDAGKYVTSLQVFHQLHCLRAIQKAVYADAYGKPDNMLHIDHCIDVIRRTITCASDATPILYYAADGTSFSSREDSGNLRSLPHVHTCRNFEDIRQWAMQRVL